MQSLPTRVRPASLGRVTVICSLGLVGIAFGLAGQGNALQMSATAAANAFWPEVLAQPSDSQTIIMERYLPLLAVDTTKMPEDRVERLSLGEAMFLAFRAAEANRYFESVADGGDLVARHAWGRLMQIRYRAFDDSLGMRELFDRYYDVFPPSALSTGGRYQQVVNLVAGLRAAGQEVAAVNLIIHELRALPGDAPYRSFALLQRFRDLLNASPRSREITLLARGLTTQLHGTLVRWSRADPPASRDPQLHGVMPEWYWRVQGVRQGETFHEARTRQLSGLISALDQWSAGDRSE